MGCDKEEGGMEKEKGVAVKEKWGMAKYLE